MALSNKDLQAIGNLVSVILDEKIEEKGLVTREDLKFLPTKDEFYKQMDKLMGRLDDLEEDHEMLSDHSSDHSDRIEALEKIHPNYSHTTL